MPQAIVNLLGHGASMYALEFGRYFVAASGVTLLLWAAARWTRPRRIQQRMADWSDRKREIVNSLTTIGIFTLVSLGTFTLITLGVLHKDFSMPSPWRALLEFAGLAVVHDAYFYWMHRWLHSQAMFRRTHLEHHKSRTPTQWAAYSFAPGEAVFEAIFIPLALLVLPIHAIVIPAFLLHQIVRNVLGHMGHELAWPGFTRHPLTRWLTTTTHHDLHHSQGAYNFGLYFTWWDRWMGTEHPRYHDAFETAALPWFGRGAKA